MTIRDAITGRIVGEVLADHLGAIRSRLPEPDQEWFDRDWLRRKDEDIGLFVREWTDLAELLDDIPVVSSTW